MKLIIITNLFFILSLLVSGSFGWYNNKSIKVIQRCSTEYCNQNINHPHTYTRTVHKTIKSTVTTTRKHGTRFVTKKHQTKTITKKYTNTYTVTKKCSTRTVYATSIKTVTRTIPRVTTITSLITVATVEAPATSVLIPPGFLSVGDDPDNQYTRPGSPDKRDLEGRHQKTAFPTRVNCIKTVKTIYKYTKTVKIPTTTVTKYGKTITVRQTKKITKTVYQKKPKTTTLTHISTRTATKTKTSSKVITRKVTAYLPGFTTYLACGPHNHFQGPTGSVDVVVLPGDIKVPAEIAYDCCAQCHKRVNSKGVQDCAGSFFYIDAKAQKGTCWLRLTDTCSYDHHERFKPSKDSFLTESLVGNGPCGRWKVQL